MSFADFINTYDLDEEARDMSSVARFGGDGKKAKSCLPPGRSRAKGHLMGATLSYNNGGGRVTGADIFRERHWDCFGWD